MFSVPRWGRRVIMQCPQSYSLGSHSDVTSFGSIIIPPQWRVESSIDPGRRTSPCHEHNIAVFGP